jgi:hypothetical protein
MIVWIRVPVACGFLMVGRARRDLASGRFGLVCNSPCIVPATCNVTLVTPLVSPTESCQMKESQRLREQSARCIRLARDTTDPAMLEGLRALAIESDAEARALDLKEIASVTIH